MTSYDVATAFFILRIGILDVSWHYLHTWPYVESGFDQALESFAQALALRQLALGKSHALTAGPYSCPLIPMFQLNLSRCVTEFCR